MLLAAAQVSHKRVVDKILLVGSNLNVYTDVTAFTRMARTVTNYYSLSDNVVSAPTVAAAGAFGFRTGGPLRAVTGSPSVGPLLYLLKPLRRAAGFHQVRVAGIEHSAAYNERAEGVTSWVSADLARRFYAPATAIYRERMEPNSEDWRRRYERFRLEFGGPLTIAPPDLWARPYLAPGFLLRTTGQPIFSIDPSGKPRWQPAIE